MFDSIVILLKHSGVTKERTDFLLMRDSLGLVKEEKGSLERLLTEMETSYKEKGFWDPSRTDEMKAEIGSLLLILDEAIELGKDGKPPKPNEITSAIEIAERIGAEGFLLCLLSEE